MGMELDWYSKKTIISCTTARRSTLSSISSMVNIVKHCLLSSMFWRVGPVGVCYADHQCESPTFRKEQNPNCPSMTKRNWRTRVENRFRRRRHDCFGCVLHCGS